MRTKSEKKAVKLSKAQSKKLATATKKTSPKKAIKAIKSPKKTEKVVNKKLTTIGTDLKTLKQSLENKYNSLTFGEYYRGFKSSQGGRDAENVYKIISYLVKNEKLTAFLMSDIYRVIKALTGVDYSNRHSSGNILHNAVYRMSCPATMQTRRGKPILNKNGKLKNPFIQGGEFFMREGRCSLNSGYLMLKSGVKLPNVDKKDCEKACRDILSRLKS